MFFSPLFAVARMPAEFPAPQKGNRIGHLPARRPPVYIGREGFSEQPERCRRIAGLEVGERGSHHGAIGRCSGVARSSSGLDAKRDPAALLLLATLAPVTAMAQHTPQPVFAELFAYDPAAPSQLLGKWLISSQLDSKLQPLRVGVVADPIGKTVGRVTVQEGDGLSGASEAMLQARRYVCDSEGSRAAAMEAEPGGVVPSERAELQVRSDRTTGAGELVQFGRMVPLFLQDRP
jgi:hypothetical protein